MRRRRHARSGFTLLEVLIAILIALIGLMGTVAIQQTMLNASMNASEQGIAMRLATQTMERIATRRTVAGATCADVASRIDQLATYPGLGNWNSTYMNKFGVSCANTRTIDCRFLVEDRVTNQGVGAPYNISVKLTYMLDSGKNKVIQIDQERRKCW